MCTKHDSFLEQPASFRKGDDLALVGRSLQIPSGDRSLGYLAAFHLSKPKPP